MAKTVVVGEQIWFPPFPTPNPQFQKGLRLERGTIPVWLLLQGSWARKGVS